MSEPRYYVVWDSNDANKIDAVSKAAGLALVGIADEIAGGIVAYVHSDVADEYTEILNARDLLDAIS
jgi:hypothetical protein